MYGKLQAATGPTLLRANLRETLKAFIFQGSYEPGDRIYEAKIAKEFNVSRSPVREAVRALVKEGLLVVNDKSQLEVYRPTLTDVEDIYQCRAFLESLAVQLTAERAPDHQLEQLEQLLKKTEEMFENPFVDKNEWVSSNEAFHDHIIAFSMNERLQKLLGELRSLTHFYRVINFEGENRKETIFAEHKEIFRYLKQRDGQTASRLMQEHTAHDLSHLKQLLSKKGE
ncbi:MAG TPA: GntR family transcriptional regulator [Bacillales bacterium]|nr:GntR family transcriptional regulator [Bacillales bacterium]